MASDGKKTATTDMVGQGAVFALQPADGEQSGFRPERNRFVAAYADRLVGSRIYVPLSSSFWTPTLASRIVLARLISRVGGESRQEAFTKVQEFVAKAGELGRQVERGNGARSRIESPRLRSVLEEAITAAGVEQARVRTASERAEDGSEPTARAAVFPGVGKLQLATLSPPAVDAPTTDDTAAFQGYQGLTATVYGAPLGIKEGIAEYLNLGWLGILFYDRLRFRSSGLAAGDQVYSLSLAPGEEVTLTQRSETKRTKAFEEVIDRTTEQELEFSSTWSTDVSQQDTATESSSVGGNLGLSGSVPVEGVEVGVQAGVNAQSASSLSETRQRSRSQQVTSRVTARAREQHKITFKVGTDITEELGSKRLLRNPNPSRAMTLNMFKVYQKYRVLLERYDAKLCCAFALSDPGRDLRRDLEDELAKLEPHVPPGACPNVPLQQTLQQTQWIDNLNASEWGGDEYGDAIFSQVLPTSTVLTQWSFEITKWIVKDGNTEYEADPARFVEYGGYWWFPDPAQIPVIGSQGAQSHSIRVLMPEAWGPGWYTLKVQGRFTWHCAPSDAINEEVRKCIEAEKKKIRDSFSEERLLRILDEVKVASRDLMYKRLFEDVIFPGYYAQGIDPPSDLLERARNYFDWNEATVQYLPWWMTSSGRQRREVLRRRLLSLPGDVRSDLIIDDSLIASDARIYLPIKPGHEKEAIRLLARLEESQYASIDQSVDDFSAWHEQNFGPVSFTRPTYEQVLDADSPLGTPEGEDDWENDWEKPRRKFIVMDEWSELLPTDGVHVEPMLSSCGSADAFRTTALESDLETAAALREVDEARAALERKLTEKLQNFNNPTVVIGDPDARRP